MSRIRALDPPYEPEVAGCLAAMMPPGQPPIRLFRTFARNLPMTTAMREWGAYELGRTLSLSRREREIVIDRTCALCGCEYEWGVHTAFFAERAKLSQPQVFSLVHGFATDPCWTEERERLLILAADALHASATIDDALWGRLTDAFEQAELLDLLMLCGWYHAISYAANAARVELEDWAPRFVDA
ncbi:MAG TPA: carboxymuconolactone decarboxylase family protein [Frankiaceae bacterium]|nr:carboxymuconolactone decarboxylase family protein [Frankiaceae bacterium]